MEGSERRRIARAISAAENRGDDCEAVLRAAYAARGRARIVGVTGPPGAGKSTFVDRLATHLARAGRRIAIVAIDPSSPFSGGALLGDRVRQGDSAAEENVFFRSVSARGYIGGLSETAVDVIAVLSGFGFDYVLLETVGAGQSDVEIREIADCTLVMTVPGLGDGVQASKAGLMETGDIFIVNKADLPNAADTAKHIRAAVSAAYMGKPGLNDVRPAKMVAAHGQASPGQRALMRRHGDMAADPSIWVPPVLSVSAARGEGIAEVAATADTYLDWLSQTGRQGERERERLYRQILRTLSTMLMARFSAPAGAETAVAEWVERIIAGRASPLEAARSLASQGQGR
ncbi:methylmalonyl Co-A mutase-associated GTPase MeaB [Arvimicrobium flavum]|uniref:methylmalonyl Co-A mutase-associated GTPase MeaB n=1 Tax=Arvimicrobium flavum TaxID=3393320 RepID=UPI00237B1512|nr:methylmalonyl Co-A mutase-associated GTPase MeaB [Mesorhizobium shangrilense]